jgi:hypothetical protein
VFVEAGLEVKDNSPATDHYKGRAARGDVGRRSALMGQFAPIRPISCMFFEIFV